MSRFGPKLAGAGGFINITQNSRTVIFVGTFTAGGLKIAVQDGQLEILKEGRARKFVNQVEQITFSGPYAAASDQNVLYVTERCVFRLTTQGLELIEVAPGVDLERDILGQMDFRPIVNHPVAMDARIFRPEPMQLKDSLLAIGLVDRMVYDAARQTLFYNFHGLQVRTRKDVEDVRLAAERMCEPLGRKVAVVVNYDDFHRRKRGRRLCAHGGGAVAKVLHARVALHDQCLHAAQAGRGAGKSRTGGAHLRNPGRSAGGGASPLTPGEPRFTLGG